jgi:hypothetical protein
MLVMFCVGVFGNPMRRDWSEFVQPGCTDVVLSTLLQSRTEFRADGCTDGRHGMVAEYPNKPNQPALIKPPRYIGIYRI